MGVVSAISRPLTLPFCKKLITSLLDQFLTLLGGIVDLPHSLARGGQSDTLISIADGAAMIDTPEKRQDIPGGILRKKKKKKKIVLIFFTHP